MCIISVITYACHHWLPITFTPCPAFPCVIIRAESFLGLADQFDFCKDCNLAAAVENAVHAASMRNRLEVNKEGLVQGEGKERLLAQKRELCEAQIADVVKGWEVWEVSKKVEDTGTGPRRGIGEVGNVCEYQYPSP